MKSSSSPSFLSSGTIVSFALFDRVTRVGVVSDGSDPDEIEVRYEVDGDGFTYVAYLPIGDLVLLSPPHKKGDTVNVQDSDGGTTRAKIVALRENDCIEVKWLEARWNLNADVMIARKGTKSVIHKRFIAS